MYIYNAFYMKQYAAESWILFIVKSIKIFANLSVLWTKKSLVFSLIHVLHIYGALRTMISNHKLMVGGLPIQILLSALDFVSWWYEGACLLYSTQLKFNECLFSLMRVFWQTGIPCRGTHQLNHTYICFSVLLQYHKLMFYSYDACVGFC